MAGNPFSNLDGHSYMRLTTFRKDGTPVSVPVWFVRQGDRIYFTTHPNTWKVKRITNNPRRPVHRDRKTARPASLPCAPPGRSCRGRCREADQTEMSLAHVPPRAVEGLQRSTPC